MLHAWYSETQREENGSSIYAREDETEVEVTMVTRKRIDPKWADARYLGLVERWVRKGEDPEPSREVFRNSQERYRGV